MSKNRSSVTGRSTPSRISRFRYQGERRKTWSTIDRVRVSPVLVTENTTTTFVFGVETYLWRDTRRDTKSTTVGFRKFRLTPQGLVGRSSKSLRSTSSRPLDGVLQHNYGQQMLLHNMWTLKQFSHLEFTRTILFYFAIYRIFSLSCWGRGTFENTFISVDGEWLMNDTRY